jgi:hypothetical protein
MFENICYVNEKDPNRRECNELLVCERNVWATGGSHDYGHTLQDQNLYSPTSALKEERMLSEELGNPSRA